MAVNNEIIFSTLKNHILQNKAILFLGEGATINYSDEKTKRSKILDIIEQNDAIDDISYHEEDGFLIFEDIKNKYHLQNAIIDMYHAYSPHNSALEKLAQIPFHLIISTTPDLTLVDIFEDKEYSYTYSYYKVQDGNEESPGVKEEDEPPTSLNPLIYSIFGSIKDGESLITSHYDLFRFVESIYKYSTLHNSITDALNSEEIRHIIFLGFDFKKWYFQLILHLLKLNYDVCFRYAIEGNNVGQSTWKTLCQSQFKISFIQDNIDHFIDKLHNEFDHSELRSKSSIVPNKKYNYSKIYKLLMSFDSTNIDTLCIIHYNEIYKRFGSQMLKDQKINLIIAHIREHKIESDFLENCKEFDINLFMKHVPYYE